ncbi:chemotaxis protein CheW, partial [Xanthomonas hortorum pv. gardneri]
MSNHTANGELDDYLEGLLHDAGVEIPAAVTAAAVTAAVATAAIAAAPALADTNADVALAEPPVQAVAVPETIAPVLSAHAVAADFLA